MKPQRIQLSRRKGFNLQLASHALNGLPAAKIDRTTPYGNPFIVGKHGTQAECVRLFKLLLAGYVCLSSGNVDEQKALRAAVKRDKKKMRGKNLACWCRDGAPCHGEPLLAVFNAPPGTTPKVEL